MQDREPGFYWVSRFNETDYAFLPGEKDTPAHFSLPMIGEYKDYIGTGICWWFCGEPWGWDNKCIVYVLSERLVFNAQNVITPIT